MNQHVPSVTWKRIALVCTIAFLLSIIPLLWVTQYAHPSADDFSFGAVTAETWSTTHSFPEVLKSAWEQSMQRYQDWQGSFFAVFLMALQPAIFGESFYGLGALFLIVVFICSTGFFLKVVLQHYMGMDSASFLVIASLLLIVTMQYFYAPAEGLYWFNGGIYYTFFYSLALILFGCVLRFLREKKRWRRACFFCVALLSAILIGGGNYTTALLVTILLFCATLYLGWKRQRTAFVTGSIFLAVAIPFAISIFSPGNAVRQASVGEPHAIKAILTSFVYGAYSICNVTNVPTICIWIFLVPILYYFAKKSACSFRHPVLVCAFSFCVYCAQATPPFYAMGLSLPERIINIIYASSYLFLLINLYYLCGWVARKWPEPSTLQHWKTAFEHHLWRSFLVIAALFIASCVGVCSVSKGPDGAPSFDHLPASVNASLSILSGTAQQYDAELDARAELCQTQAGQEVLVPPLSTHPSILFYDDITEDPSDWHNQVAASYYGVHAVAIETTHSIEENPS